MSAQTAPSTAPSDSSSRTGMLRLVTILLSIAFFVTPYLFQIGAPERAGQEPVVGAELVGDGLYLVTKNETLVGIQNGEAGLTETLTANWWDTARADQGLWRPVPLFFLGVASSLSGEPYNPDDPGDAPLPFHLIVLAFHALAVMLLFDLALELSGSDKVAFVAAALFATLPVHSEAIYDIAGLAELCAAAFAFAGWRMWLKAGPKPTENLGALGGALLFLALAGLSKGSAFTLPLVFFLVDAGRGPAKGLDWKAATAKLPGLAAMAVVLGVLFAIRYSLVGMPDYSLANQLDNPLLGAGGFERVMNALRLMACGVLVMVGINPLRGEEGFNFGQLFGFSADYSATQVEVLGAFAPLNLLGAALVLGSIALAFVGAKRCGTRAGLWLGMLAAMLITSNLLFPIGTVFAERLLYFPSALFVMLIAMTLVRFGKAGIAVAVLLSLGAGMWTNARADAFVTNQKYFNTTAKEDAPQSAKALFNYGTYLVALDTAALAEKYFEDAIERFPQFANAKAQLGIAYADALKYDQAVDQLVGAFELQIESNEGRYEPALRDAPLGPGQLLALVTELRVYNAQIDQPQEHLDWLDALIAKGYESPVAYALRGRTLLKLGRVEEALAAYERSLAIEPTFGAVRYEGELLRKLGRVDAAIALYSSHADNSAIFDDAERAEFLLRLADAQLVEDALAAKRTLEERVEPLGTSLSPEQAFAYHWTWAQAELDLLPTDFGGRMASLKAIESNLKLGLGAFPNANEETYAAQYALVNIFAQNANYAELIPTAQDMLKFRPAPNLRMVLASALDSTGAHAEAQQHWREALVEFAEMELDAATNQESLAGARKGLLISLSLVGELAGVEDELAAWNALAPGGADAAVYLLGVEWSGAWDRTNLGLMWLAECQAAFPGTYDYASFEAALEAWRTPQDFSQALGRMELRRSWMNHSGVLSAASDALAFAETDNHRALIARPVAASLAALGRHDEAAERLSQTLELALTPELDAQIRALLDQVEQQSKN